jgi:hypothetical protein
MRASLMVLLVLAGCVGGTDTRPETAAYVSEAILVPSCGRAACHSGATAAHGLPFDTVDDSIASMRSGTGRRGPLVTPNQPSRSELVQVLTGAGKLMPPDGKLPQADIDLITSWIQNGADGL